MRKFIKMTLKKVLLLFLQLANVVFARYEQRVAEKVWRERCTKNSIALNDCNWCWCDKKHQYACNARVCGKVDMFGHFNDAIQDIHVGMEGHGVWRTTNTACEPGVHYRRGEMLCVCGEDGNWPNPVCRDTFRVMHSVENTGKTKLSKHQKCEPSKLHLIGCNVCVCPSTGRIDPKMCTKNTCTDDDLSLLVAEPKTTESEEIAEEIYAECLVNRKYQLGCKTCICLRNNRLFCDNCTDTKDVSASAETSLCSNKRPNEIFKIYCNLCYCTEKELIYCTAKRCLTDSQRTYDSLYLPEINFKSISRPSEDIDCEPGTKYKKDCNTCYCYKINEVKTFGCTLRQCNENNIDFMHKDCVHGSAYESNCLNCQCKEVDGIKMEICQVDTRCFAQAPNKDLRTHDLRLLHGYCEPLHIYKQDCNTCQCLPDGKSVRCTPKICLSESLKPISLEIIPITPNNIDRCPKGHSYKIDCNFCVCLSNGNALCTTADCKKRLF